MKVSIYTDGGADPNPGIGGWAAILRAGGKEKIVTGGEPYTTNNRMELQAAISALKALTKPSQIEFYTDSEYLHLGITEWISAWEASGWKRKGKPIANVDLWKTLNELVKDHEVEWHWVKGHSSDPMNRRADACLLSYGNFLCQLAHRHQGHASLIRILEVFKPDNSTPPLKLEWVVNNSYGRRTSVSRDFFHLCRINVC